MDALILTSALENIYRARGLDVQITAKGMTNNEEGDKKPDPLGDQGHM